MRAKNIATIAGLSVVLGIALAIGTVPTKGNSSNNGIPNFLVGLDPCQSNGIAKSSVAISLASATTTQLVALAAGQSVYVCGYNFTETNVAQTLTFEYGTGASCGTGTTTLTGAFTSTTANTIVVGEYSGGTVFAAPTGNALCALTTGASVVIGGTLTYVQQ
jgi:hypothetical protein